MRNPVRPKNWSRRFLPAYVAGVVLVGLSRPTPQSIATGLIPLLLGVAVRTWGAGHLVKTERFTVTGPYAHLRHPLYLGTILVALGFAAMLGGWPSWIALAVLLPWFFVGYFPRKEKIESERLRGRYGELFDHYHAAVPALWPRLMAWRPGPLDAEKLDPDRSWSFERYDRNNEHGTLLAIVLVTAGLSLWAAVS